MWGSISLDGHENPDLCQDVIAPSQDEMLTFAMAELAAQGCCFALTVVSVCGDWRGLGLGNFHCPCHH